MRDFFVIRNQQIGMNKQNYIKFAGIAAFLSVFYSSCRQNISENTSSDAASQAACWVAPDTSTISAEPNAEQIRYGKQLLENTSYYFGPKGRIAAITNGMNCGNCHLQAGTKLYGNNFGAIVSTYPKFRPRSGKMENIAMRVNECMQRSMNGSAIDSSRKEMQAMVAYIKWVGKNVVKGQAVNGTGGTELTFMERAASPEKGKDVYINKCQVCHGSNGEGLVNVNGIGYQYPPLSGNTSYNNGAGMLRLTKLAGFVKTNMPLGATYNSPQLTDAEAWDVAAYINSQPRPDFDKSEDYPDIHNKPVDYPFGPFSDGFSEEEHKYGPYKPILDAPKKKSI